MKKIKLTLASFAFIYLAASFINLTFNFALWSDADRINTFVLGTAFSVIAILLFDFDITKN